MHVVDGIGDVKGLVRQDIPRRNGYDKLAKLAGPGRVALHALRPRHRGAGAGLAARGGAAPSRAALGAVRVVRLPAFPADRAARVLRPLSAASASRCRSSTCAGERPRPSLPARLRRLRRLRRGLRRRSCQGAPRDRRLPRAGQLHGRQRRQGAARARGRRARAATRASSTPATTATTSARAGCGASPPCTRSRPACR